MKLTMPLPPSDNALHRITVSKAGRGFPYPTAEYKGWQEDARRWLAAQRSKILEGPVSVDLTIFFPTRAGDLTNRVKAAHDILQGIAYADDAQIVRASQQRELDADNPRVVATIRSVNLDLFGEVDEPEEEFVFEQTF